jgi:hypothetical protein
MTTIATRTRKIQPKLRTRLVSGAGSVSVPLMAWGIQKASHLPLATVITVHSRQRIAKMPAKGSVQCSHHATNQDGQEKSAVAASPKQRYPNSNEREYAQGPYDRRQSASRRDQPTLLSNSKERAEQQR